MITAILGAVGALVVLVLGAMGGALFQRNKHQVRIEEARRRVEELDREIRAHEAAALILERTRARERLSAPPSAAAANALLDRTKDE